MIGQLAHEPSVDLVLLDLDLPGACGLAGLIQLRASYPEVPVVILSATTDAQLAEDVMAFGASGFIPKSTAADQIRGALNAVLAGETWLPASLHDGDQSDEPDNQSVSPAKQIAPLVAQLSAQQTRVWLLMARGLSDDDIASTLVISDATAKAHVSNVLQKLGASNRTQAASILSRWVVSP